MTLTRTAILRDLANPHLASGHRARRFRQLVALSPSRARAIRYAILWVRQHHGRGRWGVRLAIRETRDA